MCREADREEGSTIEVANGERAERNLRCQWRSTGEWKWRMTGRHGKILDVQPDRCCCFCHTSVPKAQGECGADKKPRKRRGRGGAAQPPPPTDPTARPQHQVVTREDAERVLRVWVQEQKQQELCEAEH